MLQSKCQGLYQAQFFIVFLTFWIKQDFIFKEQSPSLHQYLKKNEALFTWVIIIAKAFFDMS